jgi:hypothetical protein
MWMASRSAITVSEILLNSWGEALRRSKIDEQNRYLEARQRDFRAAADVIVAAFSTFSEVVAISVIGSVAKPLWKEVPRFREFRSTGIEVWHECSDLDLAVWLDFLGRLGELRRAFGLALRMTRDTGTGASIAEHQADIFLFEPASDRYLGRLCSFNACPKGKPDCLVPGCGAIAFNKVIADFVPRADLLATARQSMLYERKSGILKSALDLPGP